MSADFYETLGVDRLSDADTIRTAYHKLALMYHPDKRAGDKSDDSFHMIHEAWSVLSDPERRADYDRKIRDNTSVGANAELVKLEDFTKSGDTYRKACRCGNIYLVRFRVCVMTAYSRAYCRSVRIGYMEGH